MERKESYQSGSNTPPADTSRATCDSCRTRKVKCVPLADDDLRMAELEGVSNKCRGCYKRLEECTYIYKFKKPGRPFGSLKRRRTSSSGPIPSQNVSYTETRISNQTLNGNNNPSPVSRIQTPYKPLFDFDIPANSPLYTSSRPATASQNEIQDNNDGAIGPVSGSIFGTAKSALFGLPGSSSTEDVGASLWDLDPVNISGWDWEGSTSTGSAGPSSYNVGRVGGGYGPGLISQNGISLPPISTLQQQSSSLEPSQLMQPQHQQQQHQQPPLPNRRFSGSDGYSQYQLSPIRTTNNNPPKTLHDPNRIPQIESIAPWADICFFISLHMRHQHALVPLVHKPTFAQDVLQRRDQRDEKFRGLLCSLVAYTICQCPIHTMTSNYSRRELERILHRCQKASRAIQIRWHMSPSLILAASLVLDHNTALAGTRLETANVCMSEARRMVHSLHLHRPQPKDPLDFIELELSRRIFWEIYQTDKTDVMNGIAPIAILECEGLPPYPLEVDDDYLTTSGTNGQPTDKPSYITGFVANSKIFKILGQCQIRQKTFQQDQEAGPSSDRLLLWITSAQFEIRSILEELPKELRADFRGPRENTQMDTEFGIQQANIHISALCVEFALLDFKVNLRPEEDTKVERERLARKAHDLLASIPIDYLASNGESMRGKVLRIVLDLLHMTSSPGAFGEVVWDWWNMYSSVQFFQVIPETSNDDVSRTSPAATTAT